MSLISKIWNTALLTGTRHTSDNSIKKRIIESNKMSTIGMLNMFLFFGLFIILKAYILAFIIGFFITLNIFAFLICHFGKLELAKLLYIVIPTITITTFADILDEPAGAQIFLFSILISVFNFYKPHEKKPLIFSVLLITFSWVLLEITDYNILNFEVNLSLKEVKTLKVASILSAFSLITFLSYNFIHTSFLNEDLLTKHIKRLQNKEKELKKVNSDYKESTQELKEIQELLSNNQTILKKEKDKAEHALKIKTNFLSNMSHEIRTPMNVIVGLTDLLIENEQNNEKLENLELIKNSSNNLLVIINDILDFSRMESGKMIIENIEFNLHNKINEIVKTFSIRTRHNQNEINIKINNVQERIISDPVRLTQIIMNLLSNANKFTKEGQIDIIINSKKISKTKSQLTFDIKDNGIGIEKNAQEKIFESFTQASESTTRKYGGTGLGLPICKRLVEMMDGEIWVESDINAGSKFSFNIIVSHNENIKKPIKCLINEDFEMNQLILEKTLKSIDIHPIFADNIDEIKARLKKESFVFLLIDFSKDDITKDEINELSNSYPNLKIFFYDNFSDKENLPKRIIYVDEPLNKNKIKQVLVTNE